MDEQSNNLARQQSRHITESAHVSHPREGEYVREFVKVVHTEPSMSESISSEEEGSVDENRHVDQPSSSSPSKKKSSRVKKVKHAIGDALRTVFGKEKKGHHEHEELVQHVSHETGNPSDPSNVVTMEKEAPVHGGHNQTVQQNLQEAFAVEGLKATKDETFPVTQNRYEVPIPIGGEFTRVPHFEKQERREHDLDLGKIMDILDHQPPVLKDSSTQVLSVRTLDVSPVVPPIPVVFPISPEPTLIDQSKTEKSLGDVQQLYSADITHLAQEEQHSIASSEKLCPIPLNHESYGSGKSIPIPIIHESLGGGDVFHPAIVKSHPYIHIYSSPGNEAQIPEEPIYSQPSVPPIWVENLPVQEDVREGDSRYTHHVAISEETLSVREPFQGARYTHHAALPTKFENVPVREHVGGEDQALFRSRDEWNLTQPTEEPLFRSPEEHTEKPHPSTLVQALLMEQVRKEGEAFSEKFDTVGMHARRKGSEILEVPSLREDKSYDERLERVPEKRVAPVQQLRSDQSEPDLEKDLGDKEDSFLRVASEHELRNFENQRPGNEALFVGKPDELLQEEYTQSDFQADIQEDEILERNIDELNIFEPEPNVLCLDTGDDDIIGDTAAAVAQIREAERDTSEEVISDSKVIDRSEEILDSELHGEDLQRPTHRYTAHSTIPANLEQPILEVDDSVSNVPSTGISMEHPSYIEQSIAAENKNLPISRIEKMEESPSEYFSKEPILESRDAGIILEKPSFIEQSISSAEHIEGHRTGGTEMTEESQSRCFSKEPIVGPRDSDSSALAAGVSSKNPPYIQPAVAAAGEAKKTEQSLPGYLSAKHFVELRESDHSTPSIGNSLEKPSYIEQSTRPTSEFCQIPEPKKTEELLSPPEEEEPPHEETFFGKILNFLSMLTYYFFWYLFSWITDADAGHELGKIKTKETATEVHDFDEEKSEVTEKSQKPPAKMAVSSEFVA